jgi:hypothetical protein
VFDLSPDLAYKRCGFGQPRAIPESPVWRYQTL